MTNRGQILALTSSKGGVGKTHLAVSLATALSARGARVLLIDADLGNGLISDRLGFYPRYNLGHFFLTRQPLGDLVEKTPYDFFLIGGERGNFSLANPKHLQRMRFLRGLVRISSEFDYVILDLASGINRQSIDFALLAEKTIVVTSPNNLISAYGSVKACFFRFMQLEVGIYRRIEGYRVRKSFSPYILVNNITDFSQGKSAFETLESAVENRLSGGGGSFGIGLQYLGAVFHNREMFRKSEERRCPVVLLSAYSKVAYCIDSIAEAIRNPYTSKRFDGQRHLQYTIQILMDHQERLMKTVRRKVMDVSPIRIPLLEKRRYPRFSIRCPVSFVASGDLKVAETLNLGLGGMKIQSRSMLPVDRTYDFTVIMNNQTITPRGKVVRIENRPKLNYAASVCFLHLPKDHQHHLSRFLSIQRPMHPQR